MILPDEFILRVVFELAAKSASESCPCIVDANFYPNPEAAGKVAYWTAALLGLSALSGDPNSLLEVAMHKMSGFLYYPESGTAKIYLLSGLCSTLLGCQCQRYAETAVLHFIDARHRFQNAYLKGFCDDHFLRCFDVVFKAQKAFVEANDFGPVIKRFLNGLLSELSRHGEQHDRSEVTEADVDSLSICLREVALQRYDRFSSQEGGLIDEEVIIVLDGDDSEEGTCSEDGSEDAESYDKGGSEDAESYDKGGSEDAETRDKDASEEAETRDKGGSEEAEIRDKDGSEEAEIHNKDGYEEAEIHNKDGSEEAEIDNKDGYEEAEIHNKDGSEEAQIHDKDGSEQAQIHEKDGSKEEQIHNKDGSEEAEALSEDGAEEAKAYCEGWSDSDSDDDDDFYIKTMIDQQMGCMMHLRYLCAGDFKIETLYEKVQKFANPRSSSASSNEKENSLDEAIMGLKKVILSETLRHFDESEDLTLRGSALLGMSVGKSASDAKAYLEDAVLELEKALEIEGEKADMLCYASCAYACLFGLTESDIYFQKAERRIGEAIRKDPGEPIFLQCQILIYYLKDVISDEDGQSRNEKRNHGDAFGEQVHFEKDVWP